MKKLYHRINKIYIIILLFIIPVFCQVNYLKYKDYWPEIYPGWQSDSIAQMLKENWTRPHVKSKCCRFKEKPYQGKYVNVDSAGFRQNGTKKYLPLDSTKINIFVFGGSTTFGYSLPDRQTIPSYLEERLGPKYHVWNWGCGSYYSSIELKLFKCLLKDEIVPDKVIFIDGFNEFYYLKEFNIFERIVNSFNDKKYNDLKMINRIINRYLKNKEEITKIAEQNNIEVLFVWQPIPLYHANPGNHFMKDIPIENYYYAKYGYGLMPQNLNNFLWLTDLQINLRKLLYCDVVHYNAYFSEIIAKEIINKLEE